MGEAEAGYPAGFRHVHLVTGIVAPSGADDAHLGDNSGCPRQLNGIVDQVGELKAQTVVRLVAPGRCEDRRCVGSHGRNNRGAIAVPPLVRGLTITGLASASVTESGSGGGALGLEDHGSDVR